MRISGCSVAAPARELTRCPGFPVDEPTMNARHREEDLAIEAAIAQVLAAERDADVAVAQCRLDAAAMIEQAHADARALAQRTERRIGRIRAAFEASTAREVARLDAESAQLDVRHELTSDEIADVVSAVAVVAAELTDNA